MTERIILEVDVATAKKWRSSSYKLRSQLSRFFDEQINQIIDGNEPEDSVLFLKEIREEMKKKGLTQEILDDILHEEE